MTFPVEIERKFLIKHQIWNSISKPIPETYHQGYLSVNDQRTIRVRYTNTAGFLTIKTKTNGISRVEFEYEIPISDAVYLFNNLCFHKLSKLRYKIPHNEFIWEVDEFLEDNSGLFLAEIELKTENDKFDLPEWIDIEVSDDTRYYNSMLACNPYKFWKV